MTKNESLVSIKTPNLRGSPETRTTRFMLPAIGLSSDVLPFKLLVHFGFINCYLSHKESLEEYPNSIILVFNPTDTVVKKFHSFYELYSQYPNYITTYAVDLNLIVVVFKVQDRWVPVLESFKKSQYSKIPKSYAELLKSIDLVTGKVYKSKEYKIIHKDKEYKEQLEQALSNPRSPVVIDDSQELMSPLDLELETFSYEYIQ